MENNITVNMENLSEEERDQLMKIIKKSNGCKRKVWKPEYSELYFYVSGYGIVGNKTWKNDYMDNGYYGIGNCFKTKEEAEFALEKTKVEAELCRFAEENNECEFDWENDDQLKWYIRYSYYNRSVCFFYVYGYKRNDIYFTSEKIAAQAVARIGEERLKKYYFGVED